MVKRNWSRSPAMRKIRSSGMEAIKYTGKSAGTAATGLFKWATTDHSGMSEAFDRMPSMGFRDTAIYIIVQFMIGILGAIFTGVWIYALIAYGIPLLIFGHF
ncbi:MAG: hypothetical protein R8M11_10160 [Gallionella sp.]